MTKDVTTWDAPRASIAPDDTACVVVVDGAARSVLDLPRGAELAIGRSRSSAIHVDDALVSRLHATLRWDGGATVLVVDHGSRNGTSADGARVCGSARVRSGAEIVVGPARLVVVLPRAAAPSSVDLGVDPRTRRSELLSARAAACDLPVLVMGETGVGKEVLARSIHHRSARAGARFVAVNCGSIPDSLAEATLFGHERGAFTGAIASAEGVFEAASGGTLFLDEVGELAASTQVRLLRALEERAITRVGASTSIAVDVRVIAATHRNLDQMAKQGSFRADLFYRLDVLRIAIPPLRERPDDVVAIARAVLVDLAPAVTLTDRALAILRGHSWPGNVRELKNAITRALALRDHDQLDANDFASLLEGPRAQGGILRGRVEDTERDAIVDALAACRGHQTRAAARLGISRRTLIYKMEKHGLKPPPRA